MFCSLHLFALFACLHNLFSSGFHFCQHSRWCGGSSLWPITFWKQPKARAIPPNLSVRKFGHCKPSCAMISRILFGRNIKPLVWVRLFVYFSHAMGNKGFVITTLTMYPEDGVHAVDPECQSGHQNLQR